MTMIKFILSVNIKFFNTEVKHCNNGFEYNKASRLCTSAEKNYSIKEREKLALIHFLEFILLSSHTPYFC